MNTRPAGNPRYLYAFGFWLAAWGVLQVSYTGAGFLFVCGVICAMSTDDRPSDGQSGALAVVLTALACNVMALLLG